MSRGLLYLLTAFIGVHFVEPAVLSRDTAFRYTNWPVLYPADPYVRIPVFVDTTKYTAAADATCPGLITQAITALNGDLQGCVQFVPVPASTSSKPFDFLWISNVLNNNVAAPTCETVPGHVVQNGAGQKLVMLGGSNANANCCGTVRDVMRYLVNILGLRNEYLRPDFAAATNLQTANINPALTQYGMYTAYTSNVAIYDSGATTSNPLISVPLAAGTVLPATAAIDYYSITMVPTTKYATSAANPVFTLPAAVGAIVYQNHLSFTDCSAIAFKYGCTGTCANPYG